MRFLGRLCFLPLVAACALDKFGGHSSGNDDTAADDSAPDSGLTTPELAITTSFNPLLVNELWMDLGTDLQEALTVRCEGPDDGSPWPERHVYQSGLTTNERQVMADGLLADTPYTCTVERGTDVFGTVDIQTPPLPSTVAFATMEATTLEVDAMEVGWTLVNPTDWSTGGPDMNANLVVDPLGRVRWYKDLAGYDGASAFEFDIGSSTFYGGGGFFDPPPFQVWDSSATVVEDWPDVAGNHDVERHGDDYYFIGQGYDGKGGIHCIDQRSGNKELLWEWCVDADPSIPQSNANSLTVTDEDGKTFVYASMQTWGVVYKLDKEENRIVWTFEEGGGLVGTAPHAEWMHDLQVIECEGFDECLLFYVNSVEDDEHSYIRQIGVDEERKRATLVREWTEPGWAEPRLGGIELVGDHWLIGSGKYPESKSERPSQVVEVAPDDSVVWRLTIEPETIALYRARHVAACSLFHHAGICPELE
jgi:hypothetical protein